MLNGEWRMQNGRFFGDASIGRKGVQRLGILHPVRDASLGRIIAVFPSLHAVGMHPHIGRIPNGMRMFVAKYFSTERNIPNGMFNVWDTSR